MPVSTTFQSATCPSGWSWCATSGRHRKHHRHESWLGRWRAVIFTIVVKLDAGAPNGTLITNTATVNSDTHDPTSPNIAITTSTVKWYSTYLPIGIGPANWTRRTRGKRTGARRTARVVSADGAHPAIRGKVQVLFRRQDGGFLHLYIGKEAVAVGACQALGNEDHLLTAYRDHGWAIARGWIPSVSWPNYWAMPPASVLAGRYENLPTKGFPTTCSNPCLI